MYFLSQQIESFLKDKKWGGRTYRMRKRTPEDGRCTEGKGETE